MNPTTEARLLPLMVLGNNTATNEMIEGHRGMAVRLAQKHTNGRGPDFFQDLISEGHVALCEAAEIFPTEDRHYRFSTFAYNHIRRAVVRFLRTEGPVTKPEFIGRSKKKVTANTNYLRQELGWEPSEQDYFDVFGYTPQQDAEFVDISLLSLSVAPCPRPYPRHTRMLIEELTSGSTIGEVAVAWDISREQLLIDLEPVLRDIL